MRFLERGNIEYTALPGPYPGFYNHRGESGIFLNKPSQWSGDGSPPEAKAKMWNYVQFLLFHVGLRNLRFSVYRVAQLGQHFVQTHSKKNSEDSMGGLWTPSPTLTLWALHWPGQNAEGRLRSGDDGRASRCSEVVSNIDDVPVDTRYSRSRCTSVGNIFDSAGDGHVCRLFEIFEEDLETNRLWEVLFRCRWSP